MSPSGEVTSWELLMRGLKGLLDWLAPSPNVVAPTVAGAAIGVYMRRHRRFSVTRVIGSFCMSIACGFWLTPLFVQLLNYDDKLAGSIAFIVAYWGVECLDTIVCSAKKRVKDKTASYNEDNK